MLCGSLHSSLSTDKGGEKFEAGEPSKHMGCSQFALAGPS